MHNKDIENNISTLYLIGNGFDLHHGIKSSYQHYKHWIKKYRKRLYALFLMFYGEETDDLWKSFEENLPNITIVNFIRNKLGLAIKDINQSTKEDLDNELMRSKIYPSEDSLYEIAYLMNFEISKMYEDISQTFRDWLNELSTEIHKEKLLFLKKDNSFYLTFNYTSTLENVYQIPNAVIKHVHNAKFRWEELIFGHHRSYEYLEEHLNKEAELLNNDNERAVFSYARTDLLNILFHKRKDTCRIIGNMSIWDRLNSVKQINILGFSFSSVDETYIDKIKRSVPENVKWRISYHTIEDKERILKCAKKFSINDSQISLIKMSDLLKV